MNRAGSRLSTTSMTGSQASVSLRTTRGSRSYQCISAWISVNESPGPAWRQATRSGTPGWASGLGPSVSMLQPQHPPRLAEEDPHHALHQVVVDALEVRRAHPAAEARRRTTARAAPPAAAPRRSGRASRPTAAAAPASGPGSTGERTAATISHAGQRHPHQRREARSRRARATTRRRTRRGARSQPVQVGPGWRRTSPRCAARRRAKSRWPEQGVVAGRGAAGRAGRGPRRAAGSSAISRVNRWRRAISKETRATSHGRRGTVSGRSIRPTCSTNSRVGAELDGAGDRDGVHDAAVEVVLVVDLARAAAARARPRWRRPRRRADRSRTSARRPARCWPRRPGTGPGGPRSGCRRTPRAAAAAAAWRSRCGCRSTPPAARCAAGGRRRPGELRADVEPQLGQPVDDAEVRVARHHRAVERTDAGAEHQVGGDAALEERPQHADLDRAEDAAAARARTRSSRALSSGRGSSGCSSRSRWATRRSTQKTAPGQCPQTSTSR